MHLPCMKTQIQKNLRVVNMRSKRRARISARKCGACASCGRAQGVANTTAGPPSSPSSPWPGAAWTTPRTSSSWSSWSVPPGGRCPHRGCWGSPPVAFQPSSIFHPEKFWVPFLKEHVSQEEHRAAWLNLVAIISRLMKRNEIELSIEG